MPVTPVAPAGAIATSHHLATEAGARVLRNGGDAIDAALTAAAVLCVVYPNNVALGGDLVALVHAPDGTIRFVNATGRAASAATLTALRERHGAALPHRGIDTVTVPGGVRGWQALADIGGRLDWASRLEDAHRHARDGVPVARSVARAIGLDCAALEVDPGCRSVFLPDGEPLDEGELLRQPALAATIAGIAAGGPDAFYTGEIAERWVSGLRTLGSRITLEDVAAYRPAVEDPIAVEALGMEVLTSPPNTQGFALLRAVRAVAEGIEAPLGAGAAELAQAFADSNAVRAALLADPETGGLDAESLLAAPAANGPANGSGIAAGDTVGLTAVSADGWAVSLVQSVYWAFGAAILEPATGVLFQNRGTSFSLDPAHPAAFGPGRRPPHTLMPVLVRRDGALSFLQATMGGQAQAQIHTQLLLRLLAGASAVEATSTPRWAVGVQGHGDTPCTVTVEADVDAAARRALDASPFEVRLVPPRDEALGHTNVIRVLPDGFDAASDPRSDGSAIVVDG